MYLVVGATGSLGGQVAKKLLERGEPVRAVVRPSSPAREQNAHTDPDELRRLGAQTVSADLRDPASLAAAMRGVSVVVNTASGTKRPPPDTTETVDAEGTANLAAAAADAGVRLIVHVSAAGADEDAPAGLFRDKGVGERAVRDSGVPYVVIRPARYMREWVGLLIGLQAQGGSGAVEIVGDAQKAAAFVNQDDVAEVLARIASDPDVATGTVVELSSERATYADIVGRVARMSGAPLEVRSLPVGGQVTTVPAPLDALVTQLLTIHAIAPAYTKVDRGVADSYGVRLTSIDEFLSGMLSGHAA